MRTIVFCLEEQSAWEMLRGILPRIFPDKDSNLLVRKIIFEGKSDLDKQIVRRIRGWQAPNTNFLILRDKDGADCRTLKGELVQKVTVAGRPDTVVRIACCELETFYLGDLAAVEQGLRISNISKQQKKKKFQTPDRLANAAQELRKLTRGEYQKVGGSRAIAPYLRVDGGNCSRSFNVLIEGIKRLM